MQFAEEQPRKHARHVEKATVEDSSAEQVLSAPIVPEEKKFNSGEFEL